MTDVLTKISEATIERYSARFRNLGYDVKTLGWGSCEQQQMRFDQVIRACDPNGRSVLDIGCGFGDLLDHLARRGHAPSDYIGWDINAELIKTASSRHPDASFAVANLLAPEEPRSEVAEIGVMLGLLNFNLKDSFDNLDYSRCMIKSAFGYVSKALVVDFLSVERTPAYPAENFVYYYDPGTVLRLCLELTPDVSLLHDYPPIPQKEFMVVLHK